VLQLSFSIDCLNKGGNDWDRLLLLHTDFEQLLSACLDCHLDLMIDSLEIVLGICSVRGKRYWGDPTHTENSRLVEVLYSSQCT
jgi:hypothetical protein